MSNPVKLDESTTSAYSTEGSTPSISIPASPIFGQKSLFEASIAEETTGIDSAIRAGKPGPGMESTPQMQSLSDTARVLASLSAYNIVPSDDVNQTSSSSEDETSDSELAPGPRRWRESVRQERRQSRILSQVMAIPDDAEFQYVLEVLRKPQFEQEQHTVDEVADVSAVKVGWRDELKSLFLVSTLRTHFADHESKLSPFLKIRELRHSEASYQRHLMRLLDACESALAEQAVPKSPLFASAFPFGSNNAQTERRRASVDLSGLQRVTTSERENPSYASRSHTVTVGIPLSSSLPTMLSPRTDSKSESNLVSLGNSPANDAPGSPVELPDRSFSDPGHNVEAGLEENVTPAALLVKHLPNLIYLSQEMCKIWEGEATPWGIANGFIKSESVLLCSYTLHSALTSTLHSFDLHFAGT